jgi:hypothetical protein
MEDGERVQYLLDLEGDYAEAIEEVVGDLNEASGTVVIRDSKRQAVVLALLRHADRCIGRATGPLM